MTAGNRDPRLVTLRRGGVLDEETHRALVRWAADCAEHALDTLTAAVPGDGRPAAAIDTARRWARGEAAMSAARSAAFGAHAAARDTSGAAADAACAAGHAAATAHMADHELAAASYALQAVATAHPGDTSALARERHWQLEQLGPSIAALVRDDMRLRSAKFRGVFDHGDDTEHP